MADKTWVDRITVTGLENGRKRTFDWIDGELVGDDDLKARFQKKWDAVDHKKFRKSVRKDSRKNWPFFLAQKLLPHLFEETLDLHKRYVETREALQKEVDEINADPDREPTTVEELEKLREEHNGPPYAWEEIEACLSGQEIRVDEIPAISIMGRFDDDTPDGSPRDTPKCLECLQPMEWIWFVSDPWTWKHLCGRAGWTAICRKCKTWRACRVTMRN
ncbi:MAG: hypothetical protein KJ052_14355 [Candidatus Hydrogenedentes bacterium]|nr:hypothetical protein [Candidatus Hydrogenedentota bacterium]